MEFHQCHAKRHSICFFTTISKITKEISVKICWQLETPTQTWKCTHCIMQMSYLYASDFPFKCKLAQHAQTIRKNVWEKSNDSVVVDKNTDHDKTHINLFFTTISTPKKMFLFCFFFSERELKKVLRDTCTLAGMNSYRQRPSNFWLVRSEYAHASYPGLFRLDSFARPVSAPIWGGKKGEFRDWTMLSIA